MMRLRYAFLLLVFIVSAPGLFAQNLKGEVIEIAPNTFTVLKFDDEVKRADLGTRHGYSCQVRDEDNSIVLKTTEDAPAVTNLSVIEGKRSHLFIIKYVPKYDPNNTKLYYDYSDLSVLRRRVKELDAESATASAEKDKKAKAKDKSSEPVADAKTEKPRTRIEEPVVAGNKSNKDKEAEDKKAADRQAAEDKKKADREAEEDRKAAAALAKQKKQTAAEEAERDAADKKQAALDAQKEVADKKRESERVAKLKEQAVKQRHEDSAAQSAKTEALTKARLAEENKVRRKAEQDAADKSVRRQQEQTAEATRQKRSQDSLQHAAALASAAEAKQLKAEAERIRAQQRKDSIGAAQAYAAEQKAVAARAKKSTADSIVAAKAYAKAHEMDAGAGGYTHLQLYKKYPKIVFADIPEGQHITGEYYLPEDTMRNYEAALEAIQQPAALAIKSGEQNGVSAEIQNLDGIDVNAFFVVHISNNTDKDFLVGEMDLFWEKHDAESYHLFPAYVTQFTPMPPHSETLIVYAARGVNAGNKDKFTFTIKDRLLSTTLSIPFTGKQYNQELNKKLKKL